MNNGTEFKELSKADHDRESFDCGETELNDFIKNFALKHMRVGISKTMVLPATDALPNNKHPICAFYTVAPSSITRDSLPADLRKKLPHYPVPVFLLAQLSVHIENQGDGLGKITLIKALEYLWNIHHFLHAYAVVVDCLNDKAERFYRKYGFETLCTNEGRVRLFLPMKTVARLFSE